MDDSDAETLEYSISEDTLKLLSEASNSSDLEKSLEILIEKSKSVVGRSDLASKGVLSAVLEIIHSLPCTSQSQYHHFLLFLKLLRNLCAGEAANQNSFVEQKGVSILSNILRSVEFSSFQNQGLVHVGLQVLANVSMGGKEHQHAIWEELYPNGFLSLARLHRKEICDPLCMVIYTCSGNPELVRKLSSDSGWPIIAEIVRTASFVGFGEWLRLLLSRICLEESQLPVLFSQIRFGAAPQGETIEFGDDQFSSEQAFLLRILAEILSEHTAGVTVTRDVALYVFETFKKSIGALECSPRTESGIPTGTAAIDVLGYSLNILRDICAQDSVKGGSRGDAEDIVNILFSHGLIELLLSLLRNLEPPSIIRKAVKQSNNQDEVDHMLKPCPYKGFRRDIVALIANCVYRRKHAQDEIRKKNGILLLLQQCVTDVDNPFLREWGIWCVRNMLEGNEENQRVVSELEVQRSVDLPEIAALGLKVEIDQKTRRAKLVNVS